MHGSAGLGQDSVPACGTGPESRRRGGARIAHAAAGTRLLFGRLSLGVMQDVSAGWEDGAGKPLFPFAGVVVAALYGAFAVRRSARGGRRLRRGAVGPVRSLRAYRFESFRAALAVGQQPAGRLRRKGRQLRFLPDGCLDQEPADLCDRCRHVRGAGRSVVAERSYLLQHDLPGRYGARVPFPLFAAAAGHRRYEMQRLRTMRPPVQGGMYRQPGA